MSDILLNSLTVLAGVFVTISVYLVLRWMHFYHVATRRIKSILPPSSINLSTNSMLLRNLDLKVKIANLLEFIFQKSFVISGSSLRSRLLLKRAGIYSSLLTLYFHFVQAAYAVVFSVFLTFLASNQQVIFQNPIMMFAIFAVLFGLGCWVFELYFVNKANKRLAETTRFFSDFVQFLEISISSGLSIEASLRRISPQVGRLSPILAEEINLLLAELALRSDRSVAFRNFAARNPSNSYNSLAVILQQTEKQGVSIVNALKAVNDVHTSERVAAIEAKVGRISVLITVPLILFIFPLLIGIMIVPVTLL